MHTHRTKTADSIAFSAFHLDVWTVRLEVGAAQSAQLMGILSAAERERAARFHFDEPRQQFVVTRAALRKLLGAYLGLPAHAVSFELEPNGKPFLAGDRQPADVRFNVAHSGGLALIAVTTGCEIGVDVERQRTVNHQEEIAGRYFHPAEAKAIRAADAAERDARFLRCWTGKEAVLKAVGSGITGCLTSFQVPTDKFSRAWIDLPAHVSGNHSRCWLQELHLGEEYVGAVACLGEERSVRGFEFDA